MTHGYIKLWRQFSETSFYKNSNCVHLAIHLLLKANHEPKKFILNLKEQTCQRGQIMTGLNQLNKETGISIRSLRTSLDILLNVGFLTSKTTNRFRTISISKYSLYQEKTTSKTTSKRQANDKQTTTNKNEKNVKNEKKGEGRREDNYKREDNDKTAAPPPTLPASPSLAAGKADLKEGQFPEANILAVAELYCELHAIQFVNPAARLVYLKQKAMFYPAKDLLALNGGDIERTKICMKDFAEYYQDKDEAGWTWNYILEDFPKWDEKRREYDLAQSYAK